VNWICGCVRYKCPKYFGKRPHSLLSPLKRRVHSSVACAGRGTFASGGRRHNSECIHEYRVGLRYNGQERVPLKVPSREHLDLQLINYGGSLGSHESVPKRTHRHTAHAACDIYIGIASKVAIKLSLCSCREDVCTAHGHNQLTLHNLR